MKKSLLKIISLLIIIGLNWAGLSALIETLAFYNDIEISNASILQAGTLDFYLDSPTDNFIPPEIVTNMKPGDSVTREISVIKEGNSNIFQYNARTEKISGDDDFCNALGLEAKLEGEIKYSDGLMGFNLTPPIVLGEDGKDDWLFTVTLPPGISFPPEKICQIKFIFDGWQINLPLFSGFSDQEEIDNSFATGGIKINKVYYDVDSDHGIEYDNEWVEIYNPTNSPIDISGWIIEDNTSQDVIPSSNLIPPLGFAIITGNGSTWGYWEIPPEVIKIVLPDGRIGNGLGNDSDRVILRMPDGTEVDSMSYGQDSYAFDPPAPDVEEGHILGRSPNGFDTNRASDWRDFGPPFVMVISPNGGETWYVGRTYTLQWTATNPNGSDDALSIDIYYSRDSGESWANIVRGTENDGAYDWRVPLCLDDGEGGCYLVPSSQARIKIVATGPENFMIQGWDMSDGDFCPPIDYDLLTPEELEMIRSLGLMDNFSLEETNPGENIEQNENLGEAIDQPEEELVTESPDNSSENEAQPPTIGQDSEIPSEEESINEDTPANEENSASEESVSESVDDNQGNNLADTDNSSEEAPPANIPDENSSVLLSGDSSGNSSDSGGNNENPDSNNSS